VLARILLLAAVSLAVTPFAARPLLEVAVQGLDALSVGSVVGSFFAAVALFAVPVTALGRCRRSHSASRSTASPRRKGRRTPVCALDRRSLAGTFLSALVLIPLVGTQRTLVGTAVVLAVAAGVLVGGRWLLAPVVAAALLALPAGHVKRSLYETESQYQYIRVVQNDDGERDLELNEAWLSIRCGAGTPS